MIVQLTDEQAEARALARLKTEEQQRFAREQAAAQEAARRHQEQTDRARLEAEAEAVEIMRPLAALEQERQQIAREMSQLVTRLWRNKHARDEILSKANEKVAPHWRIYDQLNQQQGWRELRTRVGVPDQLYIGDDAVSRAAVVAVAGLENGTIGPNGFYR